MALGKREESEQLSFLMPDSLPKSPGHPFYQKLNGLLAEADFDHWLECRCEEYYADGGRPGIPPGVYIRMLLVGYFEGIQSQRGIAWRCSDSLSIRSFLGLPIDKESPEHSSLTRVRKRLPLEVHEEVFSMVLTLAIEKNLLKGKTVAVDSTTLEADAAMKSIVRKDSGEDYKAYLRRLAEDEGLEDPNDEELRRFDKKRSGKKTSNVEWKSTTDPDSRITRMKDGRTHLAYKAENTVDLDTDLVLSANVYHGDHADNDSLTISLVTAQKNLIECGSEAAIEEVVADKGYHKAETLADLDAIGVSSYVPEPERKHRRRWKGKPESHQDAVYANRRRVRGKRSRRLQRKRSELVERTFAHMCGTGGGRRSWLRGVEKVTKRYLVLAAARNLGVILRSIFGIGTARSLQGGMGGLFGHIRAAWLSIVAFLRHLDRIDRKVTISAIKLAS